MRVVWFSYSLLMMKPTSFIYLLMTSSLALGLMSCNKKLQTSPEVATPQAQVLEATPTPADSSTQTVETPNTALSPEEPQYDTKAPSTPTTAPKTTPQTPTPEKKAAPKTDTTAPVKPQKTEEPKKATTTPQPEKKTPVTPKPATAKPAEEKKPVEKPVVVKKEESKSASNFIIAAYNTMINEGKKIGAACNFYLERVLEVMGFKTVDFLANDFDVAAKKMFKSYKVFTFTTQAELKRHIWSYRERTGFIFQWERVGAPGHVAIVERVGETLYIYQASLNKYTARVEKTTLERLLQVNNNKGVRVYSDLQK